jgi:3-phenylpropionate/trans-cinnamate dioxygenase ferredoxin reductase subunit
VTERHVEYLLVGGGTAASNCARRLRERGADGEILLVGREPELPYDRPPLSKEYLRGLRSKDDILLRAPSWYEENGVEVLTMTSVMALDAGERTAVLSNKDRVRFDKALLATGANVRLLRADGARLDGIHYLRTVRNADTMRDELAAAERVAIVGGSYIGSELAATFTALGKRCELLMMEEVTLESAFGPEVGRICQELLVERGIEVHGAQEVERFEGSSERVERIVTKTGLAVECDFVAIGVGVQPDIRLAERAGLEIDDGVVVDRCLETSVPGIFAAGDIAQYDSVIHGRRLRIEHWDVAFNQGAAVADNMLGANRPYEVVPYFWSDLADWAKIEQVGPASDWDEIWWRGNPEERRFSAWYVKAGRVVAALSIGRPEDLTIAAAALASGVDVSGKRVLIEDVDQDVAALLTTS